MSSRNIANAESEGDVGAGVSVASPDSYAPKTRPVDSEKCVAVICEAFTNTGHLLAGMDRAF